MQATTIRRCISQFLQSKYMSRGLLAAYQPVKSSRSSCFARGSRNQRDPRWFSSTSAFSAGKGSSSVAPKPPFLEKPEDIKEANEFISRWQAEDEIPKNLVEISYSRSTGPGGQNVNKVETKASMRLSLDSKWIPQWLLPFIRSDPHYVASSNSLLITSQLTRSQAENVDDCFRKLHTIILNSALRAVKKEPSEAQKKRVEGLERAEKARRRQEKSYRSDVKRNRGSKGVSLD